jgi:hypothetical protein
MIFFGKEETKKLIEILQNHLKELENE